MSKDMTRWNIPVPRALDAVVERLIGAEASEYASKSDFVRDAVREKLASMGYKNEPFKEFSTSPA